MLLCVNVDLEGVYQNNYTVYPEVQSQYLILVQIISVIIEFLKYTFVLYRDVL